MLNAKDIQIYFKKFEYVQLIKLISLKDKKAEWSSIQQSFFIESIIIQAPEPVFYFIGECDNYEVVKGLEFLISLYKFIDQDLKLTQLKYINFDNKTFYDLPKHIQRNILDTRFNCGIIPKSTPKDVIEDLIERIKLL